MGTVMIAFESRLAEALLATGRLDASAIDRASRLREGSGERLDAILTKLGLVAERDMAALVAELLGLRLAGAEDYPDTAVLEDRFTRPFLRGARVLPLAVSDEGLALAMADPLDTFAVEAIRLAAGLPVTRWVAVPAELEAAAERLFGDGRSHLGRIVADLDPEADGGAEDDVERLKDLASEAPVVRLVNLLIARAVEARASDIHIEPFENRLRVRTRVDGVLVEAEEPPMRLKAAIVSRIKIMARLNIAERRLPQDGRIKVAVRGREMDLRVSTIPTLHGESVVMRILDRESATLDFAALGFAGAELARLTGLLDRPNGVVLVTGPTGSGKTTTLYTALKRLNTAARKVVTVEDPVEYQLEGVNQIQVKPQIGLDFSGVLRSILRQDPDVIMIGEIRDLETAEIAIQAALTGHLVLSTLHTNSAAATASRLLDMGVEPFLLTATVTGLAAQRLVRRLCPACRRVEAAAPEIVAQYGLERLWHPVGCPACGGSGWHGRVGVVEVLAMDDALRRLVLRRAEIADIRQAARAAGMRTMFEDGLAKAADGLTALEEVLRVTRED
ncbi:MAG: type II secretion system ATPase GspE [Magnetospirillum sp.]|nr:type II secretion system ATPase GspE [Magnetospirillum sp.]